LELQQARGQRKSCRPRSENEGEAAPRPEAAIGPTMRAIAARYWDADDDHRSGTLQRRCGHEFRRSMKQWRALMRLLDPFACPRFLGFKFQEGKKPGHLFRIGTGRRIVMLKEAELFSEFPYPFSPQQITLFFPNSF
jgi:hypothetical protein